MEFALFVVKPVQASRRIQELATEIKRSLQAGPGLGVSGLPARPWP